MTDKLPEPTQEIRADLWKDMTITQLHGQHALIIHKISLLQGMMSEGALPTFQGLYAALNHALISINQLIENRINK